MHNFKMIRMPLYNEDGGAAGGGAAGGDGGQQPGEKTFTQADVDRIINERLGRVKGQYADHEEIIQLVKEFGYEGKTAAEIKAEIKAEIDERKKKAELKDLEDESKKRGGTDPELLKEIRDLKQKLAKIEEDKVEREKEETAKKAANEAWNKQVSDFQAKYPDVDMDKLGENEKFMKFLKRADKSIPLLEVYEDYIDLVGDAEKAAIEKIKSNVDRSTSSGKGGGDPEKGTYNLTPQQQKLARDNSMSYKEYAELLGQIKK